MTTVSHSPEALRGAAAQLAGELHAGRVYRREDLAHLSTAVDRHLRKLVASGALKKLAQGLYHAPKASSFGPIPPADEQVVGGFLRDKDFLFFRHRPTTPWDWAPRSFTTAPSFTTTSATAFSDWAIASSTSV